MTITLVQHVSAGESSPGDGSATSRSVTFTNPVGSGNFIVAGVGTFINPSTFSLTDDKGNTYTNPKGTVDLLANSYGSATFYCLNIGNAPQTLTVTVDNVTSFTYWRLYAAEFSPGAVATKIVFDQIVSQHENPNNTTTATAPSLTPTGNNALVLAFLCDSQFATKTAGNGFNLIDSQTNDFIGTEYQVQGGLAPATATMTRGGSGSNDWMYALSFFPLIVNPWVDMSL